MKTRGDDYYDFVELIPGLFQGSAPPTNVEGFDVVVLCAEEYQPTKQAFVDVGEVIAVPMEDILSVDVKPGSEFVRRVHAAARIVARRVNAGQKVLVTCAAGRNRSGIVAALAIGYVWNWPGHKVLDLVQGRRVAALTNRTFASYVARQPPLAAQL